MVLGADVSDSVVTVRAGKALPFEPEPYCRFGMKIGKGARVWDASPFTAGSSIWKGVPRSVLSAVEQQGKLTVLVMGNVDTGKSTFCTFLANTAIKRGVVPCIIDGDIGQGDIAPPSAMGAAVLTKQLTDLRDATASVFGFVGSITLAGIEQLVEDTLYNLSLRSRNLAPLVIINTDGYASDSGIKYKRMIADKIQPDLIILMGRNQPLENALTLNSWRLVKTRSSGQALKSWSERQWRRHDQFLRFVGEGQIRVSLDRMEFSYLGNNLSSSDLASISGTDSDPGLRDVFVGLGLNGVVVGFGVIRNIGREFVELQTDLDDFDAIRLSNIRLTGGEAEQITLGMPGRVSQEN